MGVSLGDVLLVVAATPFIKLTDSIEKRKKKKRMELRLMESLKTEEQKEREWEFSHHIHEKKICYFRNLQDKTAPLAEFKGLEHTKFNPDLDRIFHGTMYLSILNKDGKIEKTTIRDIYMYQPRFTDGNNNVIGPRYSKTGTLKSDIAYCYKDYAPNDENKKNPCFYATNMPKREIISNDIFDFDENCKQNRTVTCKKLFGKDTISNVRIEYDKDNRGLLKSVNLNNSQEKNRLNAYLKKYRKTNPSFNINDEWNYFSNQCRYELGLSTEKPQVLYSAVKASSELLDYIYILKDNDEIEEEQDRKFRENVELAAARERQEEKRQSELQDDRSDQLRKTEQLNAENAKMMNDYIKYGQTPTVSSPLSRGGMAPGGMGPMRMPGGNHEMHGGPMGGPGGPGMHR